MWNKEISVLIRNKNLLNSKCDSGTPPGSRRTRGYDGRRESSNRTRKLSSDSFLGPSFFGSGRLLEP